jgi:hypothetical protein
MSVEELIPASYEKNHKACRKDLISPLYVWYSNWCSFQGGGVECRWTSGSGSLILGDALPWSVQLMKIGDNKLKMWFWSWGPSCFCNILMASVFCWQMLFLMQCRDEFVMIILLLATSMKCCFLSHTQDFELLYTHWEKLYIELLTICSLFESGPG